MSVCARCGHDNPEGSRFCNVCAAPLAPPGVPTHTPSVQQALNRLQTDDSSLNETYVADDLGDNEVYVRWEGFPWSTLHRTEQTKGQFVVTSVMAFVILALAFAGLVVAGSVACGILLVIVLIPVWYIQWRVGREGAFWG